MKIRVNVTTPEKLAFSDDVDFLAVPAADGEIGILPNHAPLLTKLGVGELRLKKGEETQFLALEGGFLEVRQGNQVDIFAETADMAEEIDEEKERLEAERIKYELQNPAHNEEFDYDKAEVDLKRALLKLKVAQYRRPAHRKRGQ